MLFGVTPNSSRIRYQYLNVVWSDCSQAQLGHQHAAVGVTCRSLAELELVGEGALAVQNALSWAMKAEDIAESVWNAAAAGAESETGWFSGDCSSHAQLDLSIGCQDHLLRRRSPQGLQTSSVAESRNGPALGLNADLTLVPWDTIILCRTADCLRAAYLGMKKPVIQPPHQQLLAALELSKSLRAVSSAQARLRFGAEAAAALQRALALHWLRVKTSKPRRMPQRQLGYPWQEAHVMRCRIPSRKAGRIQLERLSRRRLGSSMCSWTCLGGSRVSASSNCGC